jgi:hypothetical protein
MLLGIDHLVVAVRDPDAAAAELEADLGLAFTGGGRHDSAGTFNRLSFLGDTYVELIGVFDRARVESSTAFPVSRVALRLLDEGREGLATYALATDDIEDAAERLRAAGSTIGPPVPGARTRPDGEVVRWTTAFPDLGPDRPPFLIEHEGVGAEWGPAARADRASFRHPGGGLVRVASLAVPARDPAAVADGYRDSVGVDVGPDGTVLVGTQTIRLLAGTGPPVVELRGEAGTPVLAAVRLGIRWRRRPR